MKRGTWRWGPGDRLVQDIRSAMRGVWRNPGYSGAVVLTLAFGI